MIHNLFLLGLLGTFVLGAWVIMRLAFEENSQIKPLFFVYIFLLGVAVFTRSAWVLFAGVLLVKLFYAKNDVHKNILLFLFLYPLIPNNAVVPFLSPGTIYVLDLNFQRVLALVLLLPLFFPIRRELEKTPGLFKLDLTFLAIVLVFVAGTFRERTEFDVTVFFGIRESMGFFLDAIVPYYIISRGFHRFQDWRILGGVIVFSGLILAIAGLGEAALSWKFYNDLGQSLSSYQLSAIDSLYEFRGGILRISGSLVHPIAYGFVMTFVLGFTVFLSSAERINPIKRLMVFSPMVLAVIATGSRGALLGMLIVLMTAFFFSFGKGLRKLLILQTVVFGGVLAFIYLNPAVFSSDASLSDVDTHGTFEYRAKLAEAVLKVIPDHPLWGSRTYKDHPAMQDLVQGQGIIDMVNGFAQVALDYGLVGLFLFMVLALRAIFVGLRWVSLGEELENNEYKFLGVAFLTVTLAMLVQFAFTSFIGFIYAYFWILFSLSKNARLVFSNTEEEALKLEGAGGVSRFSLQTEAR